MSTATTVCVDDDLATSQSTIAVWSADFKSSSWIHPDFDSVMPPIAKHWSNDVLGHFIRKFSLAIIPHWMMLCGENNVHDLARSCSVVFDSNLTLCIGAQSLDDFLLANFSLSSDQAVRQHDRQRHQLTRFAARESEHHALIACALRLLFLRRCLDIHATRNVRRLATERDQNATRATIESFVGRVITDAKHGIPHNLWNVHITTAGHFSCDHGEACGH